MALPPIRHFRVMRNEMIADGSFSLTLAPADEAPLFSFLPGQFVMMHLLEPDGSTWAKSAYSIASAPYESTTTIELCIKLAGDFTKRAVALKDGDEVGLQGPYGVFTLKDDQPRLVLLAAGIGITPLRSMLRQALHVGAPHEIFLFYSEKTRNRLTYEQELRDLAAQHPSFHPVFCVTREIPDGWDGETTRCSGEMLRKYLGAFENTRFAMCGPEEYMQNMKDILATEGVDVKANVQRELF